MSTILTDLWNCNNCGCTEMPPEDVMKCTFPGNREEPAEYEPICPGCGGDDVTEIEKPLCVSCEDTIVFEEGDRCGICVSEQAEEEACARRGH